MGQVEGCVYMGLGEVMMEEQAFRRLPKRLSAALVHKFPSMLEYKSPTFLDMPPVTTYLIEDPDADGPFGAKEVGQGPLLPMMPAVRQRDLRRGGRARRPGPDPPAHGAEGPRGQARRASEPRFGPKSFPDVDFGETLMVPTPAQGGDGRAVNEGVVKMKARTGRMAPPARPEP